MNRLQKYIAKRIPVPIKLIFLLGSAFVIGYVVGNFGYENYEDAVKVICETN